VGTGRPVTPSGMLTGRTALVSGAGNGLGRAMALALAEAGARTILVGRDVDKLRAAAGIIEDSRVETADVSNAQSVAGLRERLSDETISVLVNNAGMAGPVAPLWEIEAADWDAVYATNVRGVFLMCKAFLPAMVQAGSGDIVNVASVTGKRPLVRRTPYASSKTAVIGLTTTLAHEVGPLGIRVNTLSPGPVAGPRMVRNFRLEAERTGGTPEEAEREFVSRAAMQRMVTEDEVGKALVMVLGMTGLTGADIDLSAGMIGR
jgi:NAD(P)-dependent dehydrogenase (short-subunit alcohol dehydrogenase family)